MTSRIRIVLVDDHPIVLSGLRNLIKAEDDFELVGEATTGVAALKLIREQQPDLAVIDVSIPEMNGIAVTKRLAEECPAVRVLILTFHEDRAYINQALAAGARGYILKRAAAENLIQAIRAVHVGGIYVDPIVAGRMFNKEKRGRPRDSGLGPDLTDRETEVLKFSALGFTNKEIARRLDIGIKSVETFKARGAEKLGLKTRAEIVRYASTRGWLADA